MLEGRHTRSHRRYRLAPAAAPARASRGRGRAGGQAGARLRIDPPSTPGPRHHGPGGSSPRDDRERILLMTVSTDDRQRPVFGPRQLEVWAWAT